MERSEVNLGSPKLHRTARRCALFLLALSLTAGGKASTLGDVAVATGPGEWRVLSTPGDGAGFSRNLLDVEPPANILQYADRGMWNPATRQILFIGQGHLASTKYISYSEPTHSWRQEPAPPWDCTPGCTWGGIGHAYNHVTINPTTGNMYARIYNSDTVHRFSSNTQTWSQLPSVPVALPCCAALEAFPDINGVLAVGEGGVALYRESTGKWTTLSTGLAMGSYHNVAYYSANDRVILFGGGNNSGDLYKIDTSLQITKLRNSPVSFGVGSSINAVDPATGHLLVFRPNNLAYEYDTSSNEWHQFDPGSAPFSSGDGVENTMATAIPTHGVIMLVRYEPARVYLYRHAPSSGEPPPDVAVPNAPSSLIAD